MPTAARATARAANATSSSIRKRWKASDAERTSSIVRTRPSGTRASVARIVRATMLLQYRRVAGGPYHHVDREPAVEDPRERGGRLRRRDVHRRRDGSPDELLRVAHDADDPARRGGPPSDRHHTAEPVATEISFGERCAHDRDRLGGLDVPGRKVPPPPDRDRHRLEIAL